MTTTTQRASTIKPGTVVLRYDLLWVVRENTYCPKLRECFQQVLRCHLIESLEQAEATEGLGELIYLGYAANDEVKIAQESR